MDLSGGVAPLAHHQAAQARHRPCARSARRRDGGAGAVDEHRSSRSRRSSPRGASTSTCAGNSLSRWKYRQVDCFICASEAIRQMLIADGVPAARAVTVHEGIDLGRVDAAPPANLHEELWLPHQAPIVGNVAALVPHKGQRHLIEAAAPRAAAGARCAVRDRRRRRAAAGARTPDQGAPPREARAARRLPPRRAVAAQGVRHLRHELGDRGARHVAPRRHGLRQAVVATTAGGIPEVVVDGETGFLVPPRDHEAMADAIVRLLKDDALRRRMGEAGPRARADACSAPSGWCRTRCASTSASRCIRIRKSDAESLQLPEEPNVPTPKSIRRVENHYDFHT